MSADIRTESILRNQVHAGLHACVYLCVCPPLRLLITSGMMWHDTYELHNYYDWLNKFYGFYKAAVVIIGDGRGLRI